MKLLIKQFVIVLETTLIKKFSEAIVIMIINNDNKVALKRIIELYHYPVSNKVILLPYKLKGICQWYRKSESITN